jgi:hypothetical protein
MAFFLTKILKGLQIQKENTTNPSVIEIIPGGTDGKKTTIVGSQTTDVTITLPGSAGTLATTADVSSAQSTLDGQIDSLQTNLEGQISTVQDNLDAHATDITGAHAATAISSTPYGDLAATDVQAALNELQDDITILSSATILDPVTKTYVDTQDATKLNLSGGTLTGNLTVEPSAVVTAKTLAIGSWDGSISSPKVVVFSGPPEKSTLTAGTLTIENTTSGDYLVGTASMLSLNSPGYGEIIITPTNISLTNASNQLVAITSGQVYTSQNYGIISTVPNADSALSTRLSTRATVAELAASNWTARTAATANEWSGVTYGNRKFIAVAKTGTTNNRVMQSADGITWTSATSGVTDLAWVAVCRMAARFVAISSSTATANKIMWSSDGAAWTVVTAPDTTSSYSAIAAGPSSAYIVASSGTSRLLTSSFGTSWTAVSDLNNYTSLSSWKAIAYNNNTGVFVAVGSSDVALRITSPSTLATGLLPGSNYNGIAYGNGRFVAVGADLGGAVAVSTDDGLTWNYPVGTNKPANTNLTSVTYVDGLFVACGTDDLTGSGNSKWVWTSQDGMFWEGKFASSGNAWSSITSGDGLLVAVSTNGASGRVMTSLRF